MANEPTRYQVALVLADGKKYHMAYTARHSRRGLMAILESLSTRVLTLIGHDTVNLALEGGAARSRIDLLAPGDGGILASVVFTGETALSAGGVAQGELPSVPYGAAFVEALSRPAVAC